MPRIKLLIAEDDLDDQLLYTSALEDIKANCEVSFANDGQEVLKLLDNGVKNNSFPDILLLDLNMPKIDGRGVLKAIKTSEYYAFIPVMILSTSMAEAEIKNAYASGASSYIIKPSSYEGLKAFFSNLLMFFSETSQLPQKVGR